MTAAAVVTHRVTSYETWKKAFDDHEPARRAGGIVGHHINRGIDDPNLVSVYLAARSSAELQAFLGNADLKATMARAGIEGAPTIVMLDPQEDQTLKRDPLAGMIVTHDVADYAAWKQVYDQVATLRQQAGIIGAAVNRVAGSPNRVVVFHQAESPDALRAFASSPDVKAAMQRAGVTGAPSFAFVTGAGWASY